MRATAAARQILDPTDGDAYSPHVPSARKPEPRTEIARVRLTPGEHAFFERAASRRGLDLSSWMRMVGRQAAESELGELVPDIAPAAPKKK